MRLRFALAPVDRLEGERFAEMAGDVVIFAEDTIGRPDGSTLILGVGAPGMKRAA